MCCYVYIRHVHYLAMLKSAVKPMQLVSLIQERMGVKRTKKKDRMRKAMDTQKVMDR